MCVRCDGPLKNVFITGHIFSHGACAAVQQQVSKKCYDNMTSAIAEGTQGMHVAKDTLRCITHIHNSPCTLEEHKWYIKSSIKVGTCADLKLMYEDVMEACLRDKLDGRFTERHILVIGTLHLRIFYDIPYYQIDFYVQQL